MPVKLRQHMPSLGRRRQSWVLSTSENCNFSEANTS